VATIAALWLFAASLASAARADNTVATEPVAGSDGSSSAADRSGTGPNTDSLVTDPVPANTDPVPEQQPVGEAPPTSSPSDGGAATEGGAAAETPADTSSSTPADASGSPDSGTTPDAGATHSSDSDAQHRSSATDDVATGPGSGNSAPPAFPTQPLGSTAPGPAPAATAVAPTSATFSPSRADPFWAFIGSDSGGDGGIGLFLPHSAGCGFCYGGVRFVAWLSGAGPGGAIPHHAAPTGEAKASALSLIAFAWAPDPLMAQLFRLLGGGGGTAAILMFGFLAVLAGVALAAPDWTRAFRISTVTWRPSLYVRPLELPG
jgi:hypothetical protein